MTRIPLEHPRTPFVRFSEWYSKRKYGDVLAPGKVALHNRKVLTTMMLTEMTAARWNGLDPVLRALAQLAPSAAIGCGWCMDFGYWESTNQGVAAEKLQSVPRWRDSDVYTDLERKVLEYAEAMTATPPEVTDELVASLREDLSDGQLVELTALVALENQRSRSNAALGLTSQGFKEYCELGPA